MSIIAELRRRNVFRVAGVYAVVGWLIAQAAIVLETTLKLPDWFDSIVVSLLLLGLPVALVLAWAFELTPDGVKRTADVASGESIAPQTGRKLDYAILAGLVLVGGLIVGDRIFSRRAPPVPVGEAAADAVPAADAAPGAPPQATAGINPEKSIAVLPFADFSAAKDEQWFSDGLTEEILNALARTPDLLVASRTSSFKYKGAQEDAPTIARQLGVAHILEGSVRRAGERLRVTVQLIRASDGFHLWSENYDRSSDDVIAIQEDIAIQIATALETAMDPEALAAMAKSGTRSVEAYETFLKGVAFVGEGSETGDANLIVRANEAFDQARAIDPKFAAAQFSAAQFWLDQLSSVDARPITGATPQAALEAATLRMTAAIDAEADENRRELYRANLQLAHGELRSAAAHLKRYVAAAPFDVRPQIQLAQLYVKLSEHNAAREIIANAATLAKSDPRELSRVISTWVWSRDFAGAARVAHEMLAAYPDHAQLLYQSHRALLWNGERDAAAALLPRIRATSLSPALKLLAEMRGACASGDRSRAEQLAHEINEARDASTNPPWLASILLGETGKANAFVAPFDAVSPNRAVDWLIYPYFDPTPFPNLTALMARERITRPASLAIPFACPRAAAAP